MFNKDFYPTPQEVIDTMLFGVEVKNKTILEPSGGKGNIVDALKSFGAKEVISCELNADLRKILSSKCRVIGENFLDLKKEDVSHINMIIANPPFSGQEKHILHMWDIAPDGCEIITLSNSTLVNSSSYSYRNSVRSIIHDFGSTQFLGDCFKTAERETGVEVVLVKLFKPKSATDETEFDGYFCEFEDEEEEGSGMIKYNEIRATVNRYVSAVKQFESVEEVSRLINNTIEPISIGSSIRFGCFQKDNIITRDTFKKELQKSAWHSVFSKLNMDKYITTSVKEDINKFVEQQTNIPFTMTNIHKMMQMIIGTHGSRMNKVIIEAFERIAGFADGNKTATETWKTNSEYMINRRFIHPSICNDYISWNRETITICDRSAERVEDIIKALCYVTGENYEKQIPLRLNFSFPYKITKNGEFITGYEKDGKFVRSYDCMGRSQNDMLDKVERLRRENPHDTYECIFTGNEWGQWHDWGFFRIRGHKKGTMHFEFKDEDVWYKFNSRVAQINGWGLPKKASKSKK